MAMWCGEIGDWIADMDDIDEYRKRECEAAERLRAERGRRRRNVIAQSFVFVGVLLVIGGMFRIDDSYQRYRTGLLFPAADFPNGIPAYLPECNKYSHHGRFVDGTPDCLTHEQWKEVLNIEADANERPEWP